MHIVLICGSHRLNAQSLRITKALALRIAKLDESITTDIIALTNNPIPLWNDEFWQAGSDLQKLWEPYAERLQKADGLVVVSPEWHGMVPSGLKNFFLYCSPKTIGHKPGLIVTVSASHGGAYPVNELRTSSYKNSMLCYIPEHVIVRNVAQMFEGETPSGKDDEYIRGRADFALQILFEYAKAMKPIRDSGKTYDKRFSNGM